MGRRPAVRILQHVSDGEDHLLGAILRDHLLVESRDRVFVGLVEQGRKKQLLLRLSCPSQIRNLGLEVWSRVSGQFWRLSQICGEAFPNAGVDPIRQQRLNILL